MLLSTPKSRLLI